MCIYSKPIAYWDETLSFLIKKRISKTDDVFSPTTSLSRSVFPRFHYILYTFVDTHLSYHHNCKRVHRVNIPSRSGFFIWIFQLRCHAYTGIYLTTQITNVGYSFASLYTTGMVVNFLVFSHFTLSLLQIHPTNRLSYFLGSFFIIDKRNSLVSW